MNVVSVWQWWHKAPRYWKPRYPWPANRTVCVVRDPIDRVLSEFKMLWGRHNLPGINDTAVAAQWITKQLRSSHDAAIGDCHFVPQVKSKERG